MVDLASILSIADAVISSTEPGQACAVVFYGGADHATEISNFWIGEGWTKKGTVGKDDWDEHESRGLKLPSYLASLDALFQGRWVSAPLHRPVKKDALTVPEADAPDGSKRQGGAAPDVPGPRCSLCGLAKKRVAFNASQLKKPAAKRKCRECTSSTSLS